MSSVPLGVESALLALPADDPGWGGFKIGTAATPATTPAAVGITNQRIARVRPDLGVSVGQRTTKPNLEMCMWSRRLRGELHTTGAKMSTENIPEPGLMAIPPGLRLGWGRVMSNRRFLDLVRGVTAGDLVVVTVPRKWRRR